MYASYVVYVIIIIIMNFICNALYIEQTISKCYIKKIKVKVKIWRENVSPKETTNERLF